VILQGKLIAGDVVAECGIVAQQKKKAEAAGTQIVARAAA
jgi:hypothetical protein